MWISKIKGDGQNKFLISGAIYNVMLPYDLSWAMYEQEGYMTMNDWRLTGRQRWRNLLLEPLRAKWVLYRPWILGRARGSAQALFNQNQTWLHP